MRSVFMYRRTDPQVSLLQPAFMASPAQSRRLRNSWAEGFQSHVLPLLLKEEEKFADLYNRRNGRPNWSIARILGICLLQEMHDLDDQTALDSLCFDIRWQHALGLTAEDAYLSRRSLVDFRSRLVVHDPEMDAMRRLFEIIAKGAIDSLQISTKEQRVDSTLVTSNIFQKGRVDLFRKTLVLFFDWSSKHIPNELNCLSQATRKWYAETKTGSWFGNSSMKDTRNRLQLLADMAYEIVSAFRNNKLVNRAEPYQLVERMFSEHCEVNEELPLSEKAVIVRKKPEPAGTSLQSPHDPDAACGYKGPGYSVQMTETCSNKEAGVEIITDYDVTPANETDRHKEQEILNRLESTQNKPEVLYADGGYPSGQGIIDAEEKGTELVSPLSAGRLPKDSIGRERFHFDSETGQCTSCPEGHAPTRHGLRTTGKNLPPTIHAYFDGATCRGCPLQSQCIVRGPNSGKKGSFHLEIGAHLIARDINLAKQADAKWWDRYQIRSGAEATMSELKRTHGMGKLRVRRLPRVRLAIVLKISACNIKRWMRFFGVRAGGPCRRIRTRLFSFVLTVSKYTSNVYKNCQSVFTENLTASPIVLLNSKEDAA